MSTPAVVALSGFQHSAVWILFEGAGDPGDLGNSLIALARRAGGTHRKFYNGVVRKDGRAWRSPWFAGSSKGVFVHEASVPWGDVAVVYTVTPSANDLKFQIAQDTSIQEFVVGPDGTVVPTPPWFREEVQVADPSAIITEGDAEAAIRQGLMSGTRAQVLQRRESLQRVIPAMMTHLKSKNWALEDVPGPTVVGSVGGRRFTLPADPRAQLRPGMQFYRGDVKGEGWIGNLGMMGFWTRTFGEETGSKLALDLAYSVAAPLIPTISGTRLYLQGGSGVVDQDATEWWSTIALRWHAWL